MAAIAVTIGLVGKGDHIIGKAANAGTDPPGFDLFFIHQFLDFLFKVLAGFKRNA